MAFVIPTSTSTKTLKVSFSDAPPKVHGWPLGHNMPSMIRDQKMATGGTDGTTDVKMDDAGLADADLTMDEQYEKTLDRNLRLAKRNCAHMTQRQTLVKKGKMALKKCMSNFQ